MYSTFTTRFTHKSFGHVCIEITDPETGTVHYNICLPREICKPESAI